jgi:hypothetical protein
VLIPYSYRTHTLYLYCTLVRCVQKVKARKRAQRNAAAASSSGTRVDTGVDTGVELGKPFALLIDGHTLEKVS